MERYSYPVRSRGDSRQTKDAALAGKALALIESVALRGNCSIAELSDDHGIPRSTIYRIVLALAERGYVLSPERGRYALGPAMLRLSAAVSLDNLLADIGRPLLKVFARTERLHAHLGTLDGEMVTYLVRCASGRHPIAAVEGAQLEPYCSAIGKVLLAHQPERQLRDYLKRDDFVALTSRTIVSAVALAAELCQVRAQGWAIDDEEIVPGLRCVAVPIFDSAGTICAALSASGPVERLSIPRLEAARARLRGTADLISDRAFAQGRRAKSI